ncbi:uncharacterized protein LOC100879302 [Megachile rotundata]|uniref:uncharacterized protein LOC100879302 n=1 Tax=Megachile rotundata TaxID=143995 RepID=UPI000258E723|nr:PREDICTED: uncharacterized protein LOC100879302 isoform X1 [Megachile rotundata]
MVTLQDISVQLMKPAKDLADWKFPLSQILEEYYALLEEPCNINFGEAALVLQNSTNVYVRRIERLFSETEILRQTFFGYEEEEEEKKSKEKKSSKKAYVNFDNFVIIDLEKDIGKNIDKKNQLQGQKKIKLLSHRFTQLENNTTQFSIPIHVYDVLGEVIGKKYDFRCNQAVSTTGMLVDELTSHDFARIISSHVQKGRNSLSSYSEPKTPGTGTSGYHSAASPNHSIASIREDCEDEDNFIPPTESILSPNESEIIEKEDMLNNNNEISCVKNNSFNTVILNKDLCKEQHKQLKEGKDINNEHCTIMNSNDSEQIEINDKMDHCEQPDQVLEEDSQVVQLKESNSAHTKEKLLNKRKKGSQTTKMSISSVDDVNELEWKPMPLVQGIKHVFSDNTTILKIPEHISLLKTNVDSKKRKLASKIHKSECLTKLILRETELSSRKNNVSRTKSKFKRLQKQELEDFMKNFDQCFNGTEKENDSGRQTSMTNISINLLDFCSSKSQNDDTERNDEEIMSRSSTPINFRSQSTIGQESPDMIEEPPNLMNSWGESEINTSYSLPDYQTLIEGKMKEIFEETDVVTELDQTVAKWHASLQAKLSEAEVRPAFRIHEYASHIINTLQTLDTKKMNFDNVVRNKPPCEVARYFLASLQLANTYNIELKTENNGKSIEIELLDEKSKISL